MSTDHIRMLCDIGELNSLFAKSIGIDSFLQRIVEMVASHMDTEVCSIYLYDDAEDTLTLKATTGLNPAFVNRVKLKPGEGLVGLALKELKPVNERMGREHPAFKPIPGIDEEKYNAFLAMPIVIGTTRTGVLTVQRSGDRAFDRNDLLAMQATASQLAVMIENAKLLISLREAGAAPQKQKAKWEDLRFAKGKTASVGFALARSSVRRSVRVHDLLARGLADTSFTMEDFDRSIRKTEEQLEELQRMVDEKLADAASLIFSTHLLMLMDESFVGGMRTLIAGGTNPPSAVVKIFTKYKNIFADSESRIIQEKVQDIEDLSLRILRNLSQSGEVGGDYRGRIVIARDLYPSDILALSAEGVAGLVLVSGGVTSHVAILARSLLLPLVITDTPGLLEMPENTMILVDAEVGNVYIDPTEEIVSKFRERDEARRALLVDPALSRPARTADGSPVALMVNINLLSDLALPGEEIADGVGLYRTEFPFIIRNDFPSEEEQFFIYRKLVEGMKGKPVTIRTLDIGGDKVLTYYDDARESNPFLGMRSIRFSLAHPDIFRQQIRAILRAGHKADMRIMFPMISSMDDFLESKAIVRECMSELASEGIPHNEDPPVGMMVELPSAVMMIEDLAQEAAFFSIGTNDLVQYTLAVDRTNEKVAHLYVPHYPAVLRSIKRVADAGAAAGIEVSVCGDMANSVRYLPFLVGAGIMSFSVDSIYLPRVKRAIVGIDRAEAVSLAGRILSKKSLREVEKLLPEPPAE